MMQAMQQWWIILAGVLALGACKPRSESLAYEVMAVHPHLTDCYTQGLEFHDGLLLESGGQYGESKLRQVDPKTGEVLKERRLPAQIFSEGLTVVGNELWLLTWKAGKAYVLDRESFELKRTHTYQGEGWGIAYDGEQLIMSDGSSKLTLRDPMDFSVKGQIEVTRDGKPQDNLNELEFVDGVIYANVYQIDEVLRIEAKSGIVTGVLDLSALRDKLTVEKGKDEVLNGIAHHPQTGHLWVTGKYWSEIFEIRVPSS